MTGSEVNKFKKKIEMLAAQGWCKPFILAEAGESLEFEERSRELVLRQPGLHTHTKTNHPVTTTNKNKQQNH